MHEVFICYSSRDKAVADAATARLESHRMRCWIAPRDVRPGTEYGEAIVDAIGECRVLVLVFSAEANDSPQVRREVERALSKGKVIVPLRIEDVLPSKAMEYALSNTHWLDALTPPLESHLDRLANAVAALTSVDPSTVPQTPGRTVSQTTRDAEKVVALRHAEHDVQKETLGFLATFEHALGAAGSLEDQIRLVPQGLNLLKNVYAERYAEEFMTSKGIEADREVQAPNGYGVSAKDAFVFLLQCAWDKGYFMAKFYRRRRIPPPKDGVSTQAVLDWIIQEHKGVTNLGVCIDVFLQRAVSACTQEEPLRRSLKVLPFGEALLQVMKSDLAAWGESVRSMFGSGIMASEAEDALARQTLS